ncbi:vascular endothelial growth factor receptor 2 [Caerostris extrusa]|uniref:Vascular endothelial growth factor receptor 2 n=1 Tax=Caerostris extrusa TaxID=172846 RepID=A0AAV4PD67_CAEEX|nr:vascular endothelial growth factor receptor 2 [Caerostris extrusa]
MIGKDKNNNNNNEERQRISSIVSGDPKGSTLSSTSHVIGRSRSCSSGSESRYYCRVDSQEHVITTSDLLCFAFQCACGMEYLASKKVRMWHAPKRAISKIIETNRKELNSFLKRANIFIRIPFRKHLIHRDLAARNVLLADDKIVKICDFGLAKDCYKYENYVKKGDGPLPIKWMAIESIRDHVFTIKSDVWSFGILMWEFFTLGSNPYPGVEIDEEFYKRLSVGYRMEKPDYCPENIYHIMQDCWQDNPDDRPEFSQLSDTLGGLIETGVKQHYIDLNAPYLEMNNKMQNHTYLNLPDDEGRSSPTRLYMNSVTNSSFFYDTVPPVKRSVSDEAESKETLEDVPMIQLDTIKENQYEKNAQHEDHCLPPSDYLKMGESCSR